MRTILIAFLAIAVSAGAQDPKEIIKKYISTVSNGDIKNWKKVSSVYTESIGAYSQDNLENAKQDLDVMRPNFSKTYIIPTRQKIEIYEDSTCSRMTSKFYFLKDRTVIFVGNIPPIEKPTDPFRYQALPVTIKELLDKASSVKLLGIREFAKDSVSCYEIEIKSRNLSERIYINTKTYLLNYTSILRDGEYEAMNQYSGYKKFDDLWFYTREVSTRNDVPFYWSHILKLELNTPIDPKEFIYKLEPLN